MDIVSVLQTIKETDENKNNTNNSSNNKTPYKRVIHFLICDSCLWCASCIKVDVSVAIMKIAELRHIDEAKVSSRKEIISNP